MPSVHPSYRYGSSPTMRPAIIGWIGKDYNDEKLKFTSLALKKPKGQYSKKETFSNLPEGTRI